MTFIIQKSKFLQKQRSNFPGMKINVSFFKEKLVNEIILSTGLVVVAVVLLGLIGITVVNVALSLLMHRK